MTARERDRDPIESLQDFPARPPRLRPGDTVAIISPSTPSAAHYAQRLERGVQALECLDFRICLGELATHSNDWVTAPAKRRAEEINAFLSNPDVRAIFTTIGGWNTNGVLPYIDFDLLRQNPKILIGYSDITALIVAAYTCANVVTFHGPTVLPELGEYPDIQQYTKTSLINTLCNAVPPGRLEMPTTWTEELLLWGQQDNRPRQKLPAQKWKWLYPGFGKGRAIGGNLETLCALAATPYFPDFRDAIFFWESAITDIAQIERSLAHLEMLGVFDKLRGMVVGRSFRAGHDFEESLQCHVLDRFAGIDYPILAGVFLGHPDPMVTLPLGVTVRLDASANLFEVIDAAVY